MNAKEFLFQAIRIDKEISALKMKLLDIELREQNLISNYSGVSVSSRNKNASFENQVDTKEDLKIKIENRLRLLSDKEAGIFEVINQVEDSTLRALLIHKFLNRYDWAKIRQLIKYSKRQTFRLYNEALQEVEKILNN